MVYTTIDQIDQTSSAHKLHVSMPHTSDHEKTSSSKSSNRILRTRDYDPHCVAILVDIFHEGLVDLRSDLTTAAPPFAHNPSHPCGTLVVSPPRNGAVRGQTTVRVSKLKKVCQRCDLRSHYASGWRALFRALIRGPKKLCFSCLCSASGFFYDTFFVVIKLLLLH